MTLYSQSSLSSLEMQERPGAAVFPRPWGFSQERPKPLPSLSLTQVSIHTHTKTGSSPVTHLPDLGRVRS